MNLPNQETFQKIYSALQDETSQNIYRHRLLYSLLREQKEISALTNECLPKGISLDGAKICYYGAGAGGIFMVQTHRVPFVIDTYKTGTIEGVPLISLNDFLKLPDYKEYLVIVTVVREDFRDEIAKELDAHDLHYIWGFPGLQYFDLPELCLENEYFADVGALDGLTTKDFLNHVKNGYAYVLEPNPKQFEATKKRLQKYPQVELFPYGAYDQNTTLFFDATDPNAGVARVSESGDMIIEVRKLDDLLAGRKVTFIKMDIEGSELAALRGAEQIIREQRPKLAICVYHKLEDMWEIPAFILDCHPDYKLYLRHYSISYPETVLYAI